MRLSLRYRLLGPLLVLLALDAAATGWAALSAADQAERRIAGQLRAVAHTLTEPPAFPLTDRVLAQMKGLSSAEYLLVRADGSRIGTFPNPDTRPPADAVVASADDPTLGPPVAVNGTEYRCLRVALVPPHPQEGGTLYVFYPESLRRTAVWDAARPFLLLGGAGGVLAVGLMAVAAGRLVARVQEVSDRTRAIAAGDYRPMPLPPQDDELRDLGRAVNDLAVRLAGFRDELATTERLRVLGQFAGGLAHQLRNAAAGAKLAVQLHAGECEHDPETLAVALRQLARIETTLRQFLALGRPPTAAREPCDLGAIVAQAVELLQPQARHAGTALDFTPPGPLPLTGDPARLGDLFQNVIGNAVEAAGAGGTVTVCVAGDGRSVEVTDTGPGPPPAIAERMFDPFVTGKEQGIGLGLAVAKQAADVHGWRLSWRRADGKTIFRVECPT